MFDPNWLIAGSQLAGAIGSFFGGGGSSGLNRSDQRSIATFQMEQALRNEQFMKDQAEHGISMRVKDAEAAGLHPLAALGMMPSGGGFATAISGGGSDTKNPSRWPEALANAGQNIGRAMLAQKTPEEKLMAQAELRNTLKQGDYIEAQTALVRKQLLNPPGNPPAFPSPYGQSSQGSAPYLPSANWPFKHTLIRQPDGTYSMEYSPEYSQTLTARPVQSLVRDIVESLWESGSGWKDLGANLIRNFKRPFQIQPRR